MVNTKSKFTILTVEIVAVFGVMGYLFYLQKVSLDLFILALTFASLMFTLYYGIKGSIAAVVGGGLVVFISLKGDTLFFLSRNYLETSFFMAGLLITGFVKTSLERKAVGIQITNQIMNQRLERITLDLSEKDRALQDAFHEVLTEMESPRIIYQALRRLENIAGKETLFDEILYLFYTHCHVEKSSIYELTRRNRFKKAASFGASSLPDVLAWKSEKMPEILRVARIEKEVIIPTHLENRFVMALPLLSSSGNLLYVIMIEEIRFINLSEGLLDLLKVMAFWIKRLVENFFHREEFLPLSVFSSVILYRPDISRAMIRENISNHKKYGLEFSFLRITGEITEEKTKVLAAALRLYDELFMINADELIVLLSMVAEKNVPLVLSRLKNTLPDLIVESLNNITFGDG